MMLLLSFRVSTTGYAIDAGRVIEVIPKVDLRPIPHAGGALAGLLIYHAHVVPAIDLRQLLIGEPSPDRLSTRIIVARRDSDASPTPALGLIAEGVGEVVRIESDQCRVIPGASSASYLGSLVAIGPRLVQLILVDELLELEQFAVPSMES